MTLLRSAALFLVLSAPAFAEPLPTDPAYVRDSPCWRQLQETGDGEGAWDCAAAANEAADAELNRVYEDIMDGVDPQWPLAEEYKDALRTAQRAWIAFRDADCTRIGVDARGNANLWIQTCYEYQTRKRIEELQAY
ncbi:MAG: lysozyme inhibitor LprI family protein [Rhodobacteraceae bacterium]|nr:lysozyme inhibitor LprI family protein [Paracoccaceae bacterium]